MNSDKVGLRCNFLGSRFRGNDDFTARQFDKCGRILTAAPARLPCCDFVAVAQASVGARHASPLQVFDHFAVGDAGFHEGFADLAVAVPGVEGFYVFLGVEGDLSVAEFAALVF